MASTSSATTGSSTYQAFFSFRGDDTRSSFIGFLDRALKDTGIDSKSLWTGESIGPTVLAAIRGSKISIPAFPERYADSGWCLIELAEIVESQKSVGQLVSPSFFNVSPSNVRNQKRNFAETFQEQEMNFKPHIVEGWRDALKEIGNLKGEVVHDTTDQAELVDLVVKRVLGELNSNTNLAVCKHPMVDSPVNDLLSLLDFDSNDVQFMGIRGLGGIGKTIIAKAIYNSNILTFNKHSFISDVSEQEMQSMGLVSLQQGLLEDILKLGIDILDYDREKRLI